METEKQKMREIKFRAWDNGRSKMYNVADLNIHRDGVFAITETIPEDEHDGVFRSAVTEFELMQFTGLKDKNGKEIYEGDIVSYKSRVAYKNFNTNEMAVEKGIIVWNKHGFKIDKLGWIYEGERFYSINQNGLKVIGNIYENKELLNNGGKD